MRFGELKVGEKFRWRDATWEKHRASYARPDVKYPRAKNTEKFFQDDEEVEIINE